MLATGQSHGGVRWAAAPHGQGLGSAPQGQASHPSGQWLLLIWEAGVVLSGREDESRRAVFSDTAGPGWLHGVSCRELGLHPGPAAAPAATPRPQDRPSVNCPLWHGVVL